MEIDAWDKTAKILDVKGLKCPLPVLKLRKFVKNTAEGEIVKMIATDIASLEDVRAFCESNSHELLGQHQEMDTKMGGEETAIIIHYVRKGNGR